MNIATTYIESGSRPLATVPYLHPREVDGILDAIDSGELIAVSESSTTPGYSTIVALAREDIADSLANRDDAAIKQLKRDLANALREIKSLEEIIGEVFAENEPSDWSWRLEHAALDVRERIEAAIDNAEEM